MEKFLTEILAPKGYRVVLAKLPLKLLAVRSGLGTYGRNNICYVPGMGSFLQLVAFYSDFGCEKDSWQKPQMMQRCRDCYKCRSSCPTGAISSDRFLLRVERCIVFHNEKKGDIPFPAWMDRSWHNCLVGCMRCQRVCPENKQFLRWIEESVDFSEEETALLLKVAPIERLSVATKRKLERLDLLEDADTLPRNLEVFFGEPK
jgi:epoxyqueuosine reductase